jgi:hypothetical protein
MPDYEIFGGALHSELVFPELPSLSNRPDGIRADWSLRRVVELPAVASVEFLGEDEVDGEISVRLYRHERGYRLEYDDTGSFDVSADGRTVSWLAPAAASEEHARLDVIGRVLALALHTANFLPLHGSAVAYPVGGIAFLAPKLYGKSTLAMASVNAGARFLSDDIVVTRSGSPAVIRPGVLHVRLWQDSAQQLTGRPSIEGEKTVIAELPSDRLANQELPLSAIYVLAPVASESRAEACRRTRLAPLSAALALVRHAKLGALLGRSAAELLLERAALLSGDVPVYTLEVVRDFARLPEVTSQLASWHAGVDASDRAG